MLNPVTSVILFAFLSTAGAQPQPVDEYQVKAAFLYNFAKFVEWPPEVFKSPMDPITICVIGQDPFGGALDKAVSGKLVDGRPFLVRPQPDARTVSGCQVVFISASERKRFRTIVEDLKTRSALTVSEINGFAENGGMVNFQLEDGKVRIEINPGAAAQERLRISSKLLSLARIVKR
jgi:hypothetical protein